MQSFICSKIPLSFMPETSSIITDLGSRYYPMNLSCNLKFIISFKAKSLYWTWFEIGKSARISSDLRLDLKITKWQLLHCFWALKILKLSRADEPLNFRGRDLLLCELPMCKSILFQTKNSSKTQKICIVL